MPLKMDRKKLKSWMWNILVFFALAYAVEYWQSRKLTRGDLPASLRVAALPTLDGSLRSLWSSDHHTVIYVFAPWCGVCRASGSNIDRLPDRFQRVALALSWDHANEVENFVEDVGLQVPILMGREPEEAALQIEGYPTYLVIDTQGRIVKAWSGYTTTVGLWLKSYLALLEAGRE